MNESTNTRFVAYNPKHRLACLTIFQLNCPEWFAVNEREDYENYLTSKPVGYELLEIEKHIVGAFGLQVASPGTGELHWILLDPKVQGIGLGKMMLIRASNKAQKENLSRINIAASHLSAPFFGKYGAKSISRIKNGWGIGMHREPHQNRVIYRHTA